MYTKSELFDNKKLFIDDITGVAQYISVYCDKQYAHAKSVAEDVINKKFMFNLRWDMERTHEYVCFENEIDWCHQPYDDPEWTYALNRMRYWICLGQCYAVTGEDKYAKAFTEQLTHWVKTVKLGEPVYAPAWRTLEAGLRLEYWQKAIRYFERSKYITDEFCELFIKSIIEHAEYLVSSYDSFKLLSNWGVLESHGLFLAGVMLPKSKRTAEYCEISLARLTDEIKIQFFGDGVHWEQSTMYHNEVLHCYLDVKILADKNNIHLDKIFDQRLQKLAWAAAYHTKPNHTETMNGDSDEIDVRDLVTKAAYLYNDGGLKFFGYDRLDFDCIWDLGLEASRAYDYIASLTPIKNDIALNESGNYFVHNGFKSDETFLHFFCGALGGSHGHNDCLHIDLFSNGEDVLVDSGRFTYVPKDIRFELKNSPAHNVITVDGKDYIEWENSWQSAKLGKAVNNRMITKGAKGQYTYLEGGSLGYYDNCGDSVFLNRKIIHIRPDIFIVIDEQFTAGKHTYKQHFHFNELGRVELDKSNKKGAYKSCKNIVDIIFSGSENINNQSILDVEPSKISRIYNFVEENKMITRSVQTDGFCSLVTVFSLNKPDSFTEIEFNKIPVYLAANPKQLFPDKKLEAFSLKKGNRDFIIVAAHQDYNTSGCFLAGDCTGFGQVVIFERHKGNNRIGEIIL